MVSELRVLCMKVITQNINENTPLKSLNARDRSEVCQALSVDLPLHVALALPLDDSYWRRRCNTHCPPPYISLHGRRPRLRRKVVRERSLTPQTPGRGKGQSPTSRGTPTTPTTPTRTSNLPPVNVLKAEGAWRRSYLEAFLAKTISATPESKRGWKVLGPLIKLCASYIQRLHVASLAPSPPSKERGADVTDCDRGTRDHLNLAEVISALPNLKRLSVRFQVVVEGGDLSWPDHGASTQDVESLFRAIASSNITHLCIYESCLDDERAEGMFPSLKKHPTLTCVDLRHNLISCTSAPHICDVIASTSITELYLQHNQIGLNGAKLLGKTLSKSPALETLVLDLNPVGGAGGAAILRGAVEGGKLKVLSLAGCRLTDECWEPLVLVLTNLPSCRYVCIAANPFSQKPPPSVLSAAEEATSGARVLLTNLDGTTYLLGYVRGGRRLPSPLQVLRDQLDQPITVAASQDDLAHYLPLHGLRLEPWDFTIEEELNGMCLFTKNSGNIL
ncbi:dynein regulatory complex subunit 5-like [Penaeus japonicus]|uniref:dynein regulatory complex subunit 5-like n=1 Tax=Penaeus japonicus TaxID=27405 RepID=UPI001C715F9A|nr:dynein regulatory complex subunit 5-like [Penaeus japonicus]